MRKQNMHTRCHDQRRRRGMCLWMLVTLLLLSVGLLTACGGGERAPSDTETLCQTESDRTTVTEGEEVTLDHLPTQPEETLGGSEEVTLVPSPETETEEVHPGDSSLYEGLMIAAVYGPGNNPDAVMEAGFIQLYNGGARAVSLSGASLYCRSGGAKPYVTLSLPDVTLPVGGYYLIRTASVAGYDPASAVLGLEYYDLLWDLEMDNKEISLLLAPSGWRINATEDITVFDDAISVFVATESYTQSVWAVDDLTKNKVAVRTALADYSGYHTVNLTRRATAELAQVAPHTLDGRTNRVLSTRLNEVLFSHPAGIYGEAIDLTLSAADGYTVYYTTDGSDPSINGTRYEGGIALQDSSAMPWGATTKAWNAYISLYGGTATNYAGVAQPAAQQQMGGYVIKAYATDGVNTTPVYTNTYFINPAMSDYGLTTVSISIPLREMIGNHGFYSNFMPSGMMGDTRPRGTGMMEMFNASGERVGHSMVEMAVSGNGSSHGGMKSLRIYYKGSLNETGGLESDLDYDLFGGLAVDSQGQAITSFDRLLLRNSGNDCGWTYFRDAYMQRISASLRVDTMAAAPVLVFINGEFWGVYNARERYSPEYVESHHGVNKDNVTVVENDYNALVYNGNPNAPYIDSSGVPGQAAEFNALYEYMCSHDLANATYYDYVAERLDIDSFIDMWAVRTYLNARDFPENNIKIWRNVNPDDPSGMDTKWHFVLLDLDMGMSFYPAADSNADTSEDAIHTFRDWVSSNTVCSKMLRALLKNGLFREQMILRLYELYTEHFTPEYMLAELATWTEGRDALHTLQVGRWPGDGASTYRLNQGIQLMEDFIRLRPSYALQAMYLALETSEQEIQRMKNRGATLSFNEAEVTVTVNGQAVRPGENVEIGEGSLEIVVSPQLSDLNVWIEWVENNGVSRTVHGCTATLNVTGAGALIVHSRKPGAEESMGQASLIAGATYLFLLTPEGDLYAWGDNRHGVLGLGLSVNVVPSPTFVMSNVAKVATSRGTDCEDGCTEFMTAILTKDGELYTVGFNSLGQLGRNGVAGDSLLGKVDFDGVIVDVSVGHDHTLIVDAQGNLWGVGSNSNGQLGTGYYGGNTTSFHKISSAKKVVCVSAGRRSTVYLDANGDLYGMGDNRWGKISMTEGEKIRYPRLMMSNMAFVSSGEHQIVAVSKTGELYYAGWRKFETFADRQGNSVTMYSVIGGVKKADVFFDNMVILTTDGRALVYGNNTDNGIGQKVVGKAPVQVLTGVTDVAAGYGFTAYLCEDGTVRVQGSNAYGQAGNGTLGGTSNMTEADIFGAAEPTN